MRKVISAFLVALTGVTAALACGGGDLMLPSASRPAAMAVVKGNNQTAPGGQALADSLVVRVTDPQNRPVAQLRVAFVVTVGGGTAAPDTAVTDNDGHAASRWTLGTTAGAQAVEARVTGSDSVNATFTAVASTALSTTQITSVPNPSVQGQSVTFSATVTSIFGTPTGSVQFVEGSCATPTATWSTTSLDNTGQGSFSTDQLSRGTHSMVACYLGNGTFAPSASNVLQQQVTRDEQG